jgi:hypothetical protein
VLDPDTFILKFPSINALVTHAVGRHNFTTLHHKIRNDSLNHSAFVVKVVTHLACGKSAKIFNCLGKFFLEKLNNNASLLVARSALFAYCDVEPGLVLFHAEGR